MDYWTMFPVKCRVQDSILSYRLFRCHRFSPTPSHTHYLLLSLWRFSSMCWTDELNKKTLKHTRREICVDGGWLFFSDAGYTLTKKLSLNVFMCSFCCFVLTVKSSYSNNFSFFLIQRTTIQVFVMINNDLLIVLFSEMWKRIWEQDTVFFFFLMQCKSHVHTVHTIMLTTSVKKKICSLKIYILFSFVL